MQTSFQNEGSGRYWQGVMAGTAAGCELLPCARTRADDSLLPLGVPRLRVLIWRARCNSEGLVAGRLHIQLLNWITQ